MGARPSVLTWTGEIQPATMAQIRKGRDGTTHIIEADAGGVAEGLKEIDPRLHLRFSENGNYYVVYLREPHDPEGFGYMVGTYQECDQRIVKRVQEAWWKSRQPGYSLADELDAQDDKARAEFEYKQSQDIAEIAERLQHAMKKDLGETGDRAFIGKGVNGE